jgi:hypothetical protein
LISREQVIFIRIIFQMEEQKKVAEPFHSIATRIINIIGYDSEHPYIPKEAAYQVLHHEVSKENIQVRIEPAEKWIKKVTKDA